MISSAWRTLPLALHTECGDRSATAVKWKAKGVVYANPGYFANGAGAVPYWTKTACSSPASQHGADATGAAHRALTGAVVEDRERQTRADHPHTASHCHRVR